MIEILSFWLAHIVAVTTDWAGSAAEAMNPRDWALLVGYCSLAVVADMRCRGARFWPVSWPTRPDRHEE